MKKNDPLKIYINSSQDIYYSSAVIFLYLREFPRTFLPKDCLKKFFHHFPHMMWLNFSGSQLGKCTPDVPFPN